MRPPSRIRKASDMPHHICRSTKELDYCGWWTKVERIGIVPQLSIRGASFASFW
jgi:hypothetical protein